MKYFLAAVAANAVSITCIIVAGLMALHDKPGWGWLVFVAAVCCHSVKLTKGDF